MSNINELVKEGLLETGSKVLAGTGAMYGHALASGLGGPIGGIYNAALNLAKNYTDPTLKYDHVGNALRALGAGAIGLVPGLGMLAAGYNGLKASHNAIDQSEQYSRHQQLQDYANQVAMLQQARQGNMPQTPPPTPPQPLSLPFLNRQQPVQ